MSKPAADISSVERWFLGQSLPWSSEVEDKLTTLGVTCVEHLKECTEEEWADLFEGEKVITKRVLARVFAALNEEGSFNPKKCAHQLGIRESSSLTSPLTSLGKRGRDKDNGTSQSLTSKGFTVKFIPKETKKRIRLATFAAARSAVTDLIPAMEGGGVSDLNNDLEDVADESEELGSLKSKDDDSVVSDVTGNEEETTEDNEEKDLEVLHGNTWSRSLRAGRCQLSQDLIDPASPDERISWDPDLLEPHDRCDDLEDPKGFYKSLGCSKMSSDHQLAQDYALIRRAFRGMAMKCHPDRTTDKRLHAKFSWENMQWNHADRAYKILGAADDSGCFSSRVKYDLDGERRRKEMAEVCIVWDMFSFSVLILFFH